MRSGTRIVLAFAFLALAALAVFRLYGGRIAAERTVPTPLAAAREAVRADNTVVGRLGAVRAVERLEIRPLGAGDSAVALAARVIGARGRGRLYADLERAEGRWRVTRAAFVTESGERIPMAGEGRPALEPDSLPGQTSNGARGPVAATLGAHGRHTRRRSARARGPGRRRGRRRPPLRTG